MTNLLGIIISQSHFEDSSASQLLQPLVHIDGHFVVVFIGLVAQTKYLWEENDKINDLLNVHVNT